ncbi:cuticle protein 64-like [Bombyx mori]|uniref:cuticle protein 64-like n=1 Tax=Bombyx mori TaxID=7091 RepID=UPI0003502C7C
MFGLISFLACVAACSSHAVLPLVAPAAIHSTAFVAPYPVHGYGGHGWLGHGSLGHGLPAKPFGHHVLKRSPHLVAPLAHAAHVAPIAHVAPVAVSHQSRLDVHTSPAVVAAPILPVVKPIVAPVIQAAPLLGKSFVASPVLLGAGHLGVGSLGGGYLGGGYFGAGHLGGGHLGGGHLGGGYLGSGHLVGGHLGGGHLGGGYLGAGNHGHYASLHPY